MIQYLLVCPLFLYLFVSILSGGKLLDELVSMAVNRMSSAIQKTRPSVTPRLTKPNLPKKSGSEMQQELNLKSKSSSELLDELNLKNKMNSEKQTEKYKENEKKKKVENLEEKNKEEMETPIYLENKTISEPEKLNMTNGSISEIQVERKSNNASVLESNTILKYEDDLNLKSNIIPELEEKVQLENDTMTKAEDLLILKRRDSLEKDTEENRESNIRLDTQDEIYMDSDTISKPEEELNMKNERICKMQKEKYNWILERAVLDKNVYLSKLERKNRTELEVHVEQSSTPDMGVENILKQEVTSPNNSKPKVEDQTSSEMETDLILNIKPESPKPQAECSNALMLEVTSPKPQAECSNALMLEVTNPKPQAECSNALMLEVTSPKPQAECSNALMLEVTSPKPQAECSNALMLEVTNPKPQAECSNALMLEVTSPKPQAECSNALMLEVTSPKPQAECSNDLMLEVTSPKPQAECSNALMLEVTSPKPQAECSNALMLEVTNPKPQAECSNALMLEVTSPKPQAECSNALMLEVTSPKPQAECSNDLMLEVTSPKPQAECSNALMLEVTSPKPQAECSNDLMLEVTSPKPQAECSKALMLEVTSPKPQAECSNALMLEVTSPKPQAECTNALMLEVTSPKPQAECSKALMLEVTSPKPQAECSNAFMLEVTSPKPQAECSKALMLEVSSPESSKITINTDGSLKSELDTMSNLQVESEDTECNSLASEVDVERVKSMARHMFKETESELEDFWASDKDSEDSEELGGEHGTSLESELENSNDLKIKFKRLMKKKMSRLKAIKKWKLARSHFSSVGSSNGVKNSPELFLKHGSDLRSHIENANSMKPKIDRQTMERKTHIKAMVRNYHKHILKPISNLKSKIYENRLKVKKEKSESEYNFQLHPEHTSGSSSETGSWSLRQPDVTTDKCSENSLQLCVEPRSSLESEIIVNILTPVLQRKSTSKQEIPSNVSTKYEVESKNNLTSVSNKRSDNSLEFGLELGSSLQSELENADNLKTKLDRKLDAKPDMESENRSISVSDARSENNSELVIEFENNLDSEVRTAHSLKRKSERENTSKLDMLNSKETKLEPERINSSISGGENNLRLFSDIGHNLKSDAENAHILGQKLERYNTKPENKSTESKRESNICSKEIVTHEKSLKSKVENVQQLETGIETAWSSQVDIEDGKVSRLTRKHTPEQNTISRFDKDNTSSFDVEVERSFAPEAKNQHNLKTDILSHSRPNAKQLIAKRSTPKAIRESCENNEDGDAKITMGLNNVANFQNDIERSRKLFVREIISELGLKKSSSSNTNDDLVSCLNLQTVHKEKLKQRTKAENNMDQDGGSVGSLERDTENNTVTNVDSYQNCLEPQVERGDASIIKDTAGNYLPTETEFANLLKSKMEDVIRSEAEKRGLGLNEDEGNNQEIERGDASMIHETADNYSLSETEFASLLKAEMEEIIHSEAVKSGIRLNQDSRNNQEIERGDASMIHETAKNYSLSETEFASLLKAEMEDILRSEAEKSGIRFNQDEGNNQEVVEEKVGSLEPFIENSANVNLNVSCQNCLELQGERSDASVIKQTAGNYLLPETEFANLLKSKIEDVMRSEAETRGISLKEDEGNKQEVERGDASMIHETAENYSLSETEFASLLKAEMDDIIRSEAEKSGIRFNQDEGNNQEAGSRKT